MVRAGDALAGAPDAIDDDRIAGVAFEDEVEVGGAGGGVAAGDEVEDAAFGGEDGDPAALLVEEHGEALGGAIVDDEAGNDGVSMVASSSARRLRLAWASAKGAATTLAGGWDIQLARMDAAGGDSGCEDVQSPGRLLPEVGSMSMAARLFRVDDEAGDDTVALPVDLREKLGLRRGDLVSVVETPDGLLLTSRGGAIERELAGVDAELREHGLSLDEMVESGREIRSELVKERYGLDG